MWYAPRQPEVETLESPVVPAVTALVRLLDALRDIIEKLTDEAYAGRPDDLPSGSVGAHVRHCLDHVATLLDGIAGGALTYDRRIRGTRVETCRAAALARVRSLTEALLDLDPCALQRPLRVDVQLDPAGTTCSVLSTAGRELAFVISHTIHHNATIRLLLDMTGQTVPQRFGMAPATPIPASPSLCAR